MTRSPGAAEAGQDAGTFRFYRLRAGAARATPVGAIGDYSVRIWHPSWTRVPPPLVRTSVNWVWWLLHNVRVFRSRAFAVISLEQEGRLIHRSTVFPPFFRFPFMRGSDIQVGDTWTEESHRGRSLARLAIRTACAAAPAAGDVWYIVEESNAPSIHVVEKEGFELVARGARVPRLGMRLLGYYAMTSA
ncbi:MAG: GNAT family N-acetyltransferase [bacterium]